MESSVTSQLFGKFLTRVLIFTTPLLHFASSPPEFYQGEIVRGYQQLRQLCNETGVTFMEKDSVELAEIPSVRFTGCTLWSHIPLYAQVLELTRLGVGCIWN